ncbi:molluscan insulin-related peptide 3-like [Mercenaria mercenaria]|uniref:molluscan insulin-related peptide 3-like n=1 Tax=Mercenaria mercenaria TaxID=6596 RepID=UPI00234EC8F7|nr:molluscan insulin-related peptide 3-like [Mercenaria mercenaria]
MMMNIDTWYIVTMLTISLFHSVTANWNRVCTPFTKSFGPHPHGLCGSRIDETLDLLCVGGYNEYPSYGGFRRKREISERHLEDLSGILIRRQEANSYLVKRSSFYERGIVCECCYHRCSVFELFSYCRGEPGLLGLFKRSVGEQKQSFRHDHSND